MDGSCVDLAFEERSGYTAYLDSAYALGIVSAHFNRRHVLLRYYSNIAAVHPAEFHKAGGCPLYIAPWSGIDAYVARGYLRKDAPDFPATSVCFDKFLHWCIQSICHGSFVYATVNEQYLAGTEAYSGHSPFMHPCLLSGWDGSRRLFKAHTYLANGAFGSVWIPVSDWLMSFFARGTEQPGGAYFYEPVLYAVRCNPAEQVRQCFSCLQTATILTHYATSRLEKFEFNEREYCGLLGVRQYLEEVLATIHRKQGIDVRGTRALLEHRQIMRLNVRYILEQMGSLRLDTAVQDSETLVKWARTLHLLAYTFDRSLGGHEASDFDRALLQHLATRNQMLKVDRRLVNALLGILC